jgi:pimeloyl-ACP methyl ester carboxylesterase
MKLLLLSLLPLCLLATLLAVACSLLARRIEAAVPAAGEYLDVDGVRIHYRSLGRGPALVMLHGIGGQMGHFDYLPLLELASRYRLVLVDRPGFGHSPRDDTGPAGIAAQAQVVAAFIRALGLPRPLLVGHSVGGAVALGVALHDPECIEAVALIAPLAEADAALPALLRGLAIRTPWLRRLFARVLAMPLALARRRWMQEALFGPDGRPRDFDVRGGGLLALRPSHFYAAASDLCVAQQELRRLQERFGELALPVHILCGDRDRILDWRVHGQGLQQKVPQARLHLIAGGHMLPVTHPAQTAAWLERAADASWDPAQ